jgi:hypothetical protein
MKDISQTVKPFVNLVKKMKKSTKNFDVATFLNTIHGAPEDYTFLKKVH